MINIQEKLKINSQSKVQDQDSIIKSLHNKIRPLMVEMFLEYYDDRKEAENTVDFFERMCNAIKENKCNNFDDLIYHLKDFDDFKN